jgi:hypothetical protein
MEGMLHVLFDGGSQVEGHVCEGHREMVSLLGCAEEDETGDCSHVQYRACRCKSEPPCVICSQERLPEPVG